MEDAYTSKLTDLIRKEIEKRDSTLLEAVFSRRGRGGTLNVIVDRSGGITVEECADINRAISERLETENPGSSEYAVEVSSPGLDVVLKNDFYLKWAIGKKVRVDLSGDQGNTTCEGVLKSVENDILKIELSNGEISELEKKNITKTRLAVDTKF